MGASRLISLTGAAPRRCPLRMPAAWQPPVPAWCSDLAAVTRPVVATLGVQSRASEAPPEAERLRVLAASAAARVEQAWYVDARGYRNDVLIAYFRDEPAWHRYAGEGEFAEWWSAPMRLSGALGYWREFFVAPDDHRETLFSADDRPAGLASLGTRLIGPITEHGYWGGARDRIPRSALETLATERSLERRASATLGRRVTVAAPTHACVIRSAQDATDCTGEELELYERRVRPVLQRGMDYLRDHATETGCFSCRLMQEPDPEGSPSRRTFALAHFVSLGALERWAATHETHLAIFDEFLAMAGELGPAMRLRLWHEVYVLPEHAGRFEYLNCHPDTGLLPFEPPIEAD